MGVQAIDEKEVKAQEKKAQLAAIKEAAYVELIVSIGGIRSNVNITKKEAERLICRLGHVMTVVTFRFSDGTTETTLEERGCGLEMDAVVEEITGNN